MNPDTGHIEVFSKDEPIPEGYVRIDGTLYRQETIRLLNEAKTNQTFIDDKSPTLTKLAKRLKSSNKKLRSKAKKVARARNREAGKHQQ